MNLTAEQSSVKEVADIVSRHVKNNPKEPLQQLELIQRVEEESGEGLFTFAEASAIVRRAEVVGTIRAVNYKTLFYRDNWGYVA